MKYFVAIILCICSIIAFSQDRNIPIDSLGYIGLIDEFGIRHSDWLEADTLDQESYLPYFGFRRGKDWGLCDTNLVDQKIGWFKKLEKRYQRMYGLSDQQLIVFNESLKKVASIEDVKNFKFRSKVEIETDAVEADHFLIIETTNGFGLINQNGEWILQPEYDKAFYMNGIVYLRNGHLFGFFAPYAKRLVKPEWFAIGQFNDFIIEAHDKNNRRSYFLKDGRQIPATDSTLVVDKQSNTIKIYQNGKGELYDFDLKLQIKYQGEDIFSIDGRRRYLWSEHESKRKRTYAIKRNGKIGCVNERGQKILSFKYENINRIGEDFYRVVLNGKYGIVNDDEVEIIPCNYTFIEAKKSYFKIYDYEKKGLMDHEGQVIVPPKYEELYLLSYGIVTKQNERYGFFTFDGKEVLKPAFQAYWNNSGLEFESGQGICMVGAEGLITALNCQFIYRNRKMVKYHVNNQVIIHNLLDEVVIDTTVYTVQRSIKKTYDTKRSRLILSEHKHQRSLDQLTGKIGAIRKEGDGYSIKPQFFNVFDRSSAMVKAPYNDTVTVNGMTRYVKEVLIDFMPAIGRIGRQYFSLMSSGYFTGWHSSSFNPALTLEKEWTYHAENKYMNKNVPFIQRRYKSYSKVLQEGELNLEEGEPLMDYKSYYEQMNEYHNLLISDKRMFDLLEASPMIRVKDPVWEVFKISNLGIITRLGSFESFMILPSGNAIVKKANEGFGVLNSEEKFLIPTHASQVYPITVQSFDYYLLSREVESLGGISETKVEVYDFDHKIHSSNRLIEVVAPGYFKIERYGILVLVNVNGNVIYTYP